MIEEEETPNLSLRNLIETKIIVEFEIQDGLIHEEAQMQFKPDILLKDMIEKIIDNFNAAFKENNKNIYLRPEGINYKLCECKDYEVGPGQFKISNLNYLNGFTKLNNTTYKNFRLYCDPHDVLLNFNEKKGCKCIIS